MKRFCDICKKIVYCEYCTKYGTDGIYIQLEKQMIIRDKHKKIHEIPQYNTDLIEAAQYNSISRFNKS
jgi:hypothetical protein